MKIEQVIGCDDNLRQFFAFLPHSERIHIQQMQFKTGDVIFERYDQPDYLYLVLDGICDCMIYASLSVTHITLQTIGYMDIIGLYELIHDISRCGSLVARTSLSVLAMHKDEVKHWVEQYPRFVLNMSTSISNRLYSQSEYLSWCTKYSASCGVISVALQEWEILNRKEEKYTQIELHLSQQEIAEIIGKSLRSVNRAVGELKKLDVIEVRQNKIIIHAQCVERLRTIQVEEVSNR